MAATCAGLGDSQASQALHLGWLLLVLGLGLTEASCCLFAMIYKVVKLSQYQPFVRKSGLGGPVSWWGRVSGDLQGQSNNVSQLASSVGEGFRKGTMASAGLDVRHFSFSLYRKGETLAPFKLLP